jgi:hypothetical protein
MVNILTEMEMALVAIVNSISTVSTIYQMVIYLYKSIQ